MKEEIKQGGWRRRPIRVLEQGFATEETLRAFIGSDLRGPANEAGVYFLLNEKQRVVYVGAAKNVHKRIAQHRHTGKQFTSAVFVAIPAEWERKDIEMRFVVAIQPKLNDTGRRRTYSGLSHARCDNLHRFSRAIF